MKKLVGLLLTLTMVISLALTGCGGSGSGGTGNGGSKDSAGGIDNKDSGSGPAASEAPDENGGTKSETKAGAASDKGGEKVTLKLFHNWINVDETPYFEDLAEEFEATHENVEIVIENVGDPDYKSKLKVMLGADEAPDIFFSWSGEFGQKFARAGSVLDLAHITRQTARGRIHLSRHPLFPLNMRAGFTVCRSVWIVK